MRKVIAVDGTFLKDKFRGTLIVATAQDGDTHIYPIAFGIVDSENDAAYKWFISRLKSVIPDHPNLVFISDRHQSIEKAITTVFPSANRGICFFHSEKNLITNHRANRLPHLVKKAANTYSRDEFTNIMDEIRRLNPKLSKDLEDADIRLWSHAHFQGNRYNIITNNIAESINGLLKEPREYPIVAFLDHVRDILARWFCERREKAAKLVTELGPYADRKVEARRVEADTLAVQPINLNQFHVTGGSQDPVVDMQKLSCSCGAFDIEKIPCKHAIAVAKKKQIQAHTLSDPCYTRNYLFAAYSESIFPVLGILNDSQIPP
ncbi:hypothetical protein V5N11_025741 [Cardamine amara subsp. amara]|uniref:SWIM-type domain-containing protein n=1 Tax=Cardamine amara subsp. amara TaxID=228776 RepID=A0ABD0ZQI3_CARAN